MKLFIQILLAGSAMILFFACSELNNNIETAQKISAHGKGILDPSSTEFHGQLIKSANWDLSVCWKCHASDYSGGVTGASCLDCHTETDGPEACNTCHGDPNNPDKIAPPKDLDGNTSTTFRGVGAHDSHVYSNQLTENLKCSNCHKFPTSFDDPAHIDGDGRAEITFGRIAVTGQGVNSAYDQGSGSCSNTYCHGNFVFYKDSSVAGAKYIFEDSVIVGNNVSVNWTAAGQSQAECGSCHGLPPTGHIQFSIGQCGLCHEGIFDANGNIVDSLKYKHINGEINVIILGQGG